MFRANSTTEFRGSYLRYWLGTSVNNCRLILHKVVKNISSRPVCARWCQKLTRWLTKQGFFCSRRPLVLLKLFHPFHPKMPRKFLGQLFRPVKPFFVHLYLKTETCIHLNLLVCTEPLFILNMDDKKKTAL